MASSGEFKGIAPGIQRYLQWFDRYPLTEELVTKMLNEQFVINGLAIFELSAPMWVLDVEDRLTERLKTMLSDNGRPLDGDVTDSRLNPI